MNYKLKMKILLEKFIFNAKLSPVFETICPCGAVRTTL